MSLDPMRPTPAEAEHARDVADHVRKLQPLTLAEAHRALGGEAAAEGDAAEDGEDGAQ